MVEPFLPSILWWRGRWPRGPGEIRSVRGGFGDGSAENPTYGITVRGKISRVNWILGYHRSQIPPHALLLMNLLNGTTPSPVLVRAIQRTLRPLVRLMLASGVTFPLVSELLKGVFVEVADREFRLGDQAPTDSRISLISGVHRKDVRRLRSADQAIDEVVPDTISFGGRLVTTWLTDERFLDEEGRPRPLAKTRTTSDEACLEDLIANRRTDIRLRVVLDEWLRLGVVHSDPQGRLVLNTDAFVPQAGLEEKLFFFAHNLHDHAAAATDNLLGSRPPQLERSLIYEGLTEEGIALLDKRARQLGTRMLQELNRLASEREDAETTSTSPRRRFTCGVYFYSEAAQGPGPEPK